RIGEDNTINHKPLDKDLIIEKDFLPAGKVNVGITSGASTPDRAVEHVIQKLIELSSR
ncbi:MAG: 4-hydroxy-3-methylbut-2-enyl diphosphate reductase, partial [Prochlorococcus sp.]